MAHETPKIYTKTGDQGETSLIGGKRVSKAELRLNTYGSVDELNAVVGLLAAHIKGESDLRSLLQEIQNSLFDIGSHLACDDEKIAAKMPKINLALISTMESWIDSAETKLKPLKNFILPGGGMAGAHAHLARTVTRRAERVTIALSKKSFVDDDVIRFLNRLSDFLFVVARYLNHAEGIEDVIWSSKKSTAK